MTKKNYPCTQRELYAVCTSGWMNCQQNLEKFSAFRPVYTAAFLEARLKEVADAAAMPHRSKRSVNQGFARAELKAKMEQCHDEWNKLKLTLPMLFPGQPLDLHYKDMGEEYYADSKYLKWEACTGLMDSALDFVQKHAVILNASDRLGPKFAEGFKLLRDELHALLQAYVSIMGDGSKGAEDKLKACNAIYEELKSLHADARILFKKDETTLNKFRFESQLDLVSGQNGSGIKGSISNGQVPVHLLPGLLLSLTENGDEAYISENGTYRFSQLSAGSYTMMVKANGYKEQLIPNILVNTGSFSIRDIVLVPEEPEKEG
jgi:hypothetical protein